MKFSKFNLGGTMTQMALDVNKMISELKRSYSTSSYIESDESATMISVDEESEYKPLICADGENFGRPISICFAGVGTCGVNILMGIKRKNEHNKQIDFVGINTDGASIKELAKVGVTKNIGLSANGACLGAGGDVEVAKKLGEKYYDQFKERFQDVDLTLVVTGLGGGTGTGVAPLVAKASREVQNGKQHKLTIGVTAIPSAEEAHRRQLALDNIEEFKKSVDALVLIDNEKVFEIPEMKGASYNKQDSFIDSKFHAVLQSILDVITTYTKRNIDFADICSTLENCGEAIITNVEAKSEDVEGIKTEISNALNDPLLFDHKGYVATRLLIYHFFDEDYPGENHKNLVREVERIVGWTQTNDGYYRCIYNDKDRSINHFSKIGSGFCDKGLTKVIVIASGFVKVSEDVTDKEAKQQLEQIPESQVIQEVMQEIEPELEVEQEVTQITESPIQEIEKKPEESYLGRLLSQEVFA